MFSSIQLTISLLSFMVNLTIERHYYQRGVIASNSPLYSLLDVNRTLCVNIHLNVTLRL